MPVEEFGSLKVKHLDTPSPTLSSLLNIVIPPSLEHILDIVMRCKSSFVYHNNPLYYEKIGI
jgi:hypothetical protein